MATLHPELKHMLLVGPPGSGKGTLGPHLSELLKVPHVSSGQLLRASVNAGDPFHIGEQVTRGHLVPDRVVAQVVAEHLADGFILDGYPRNVRQAEELDRVLAADGRQVQLVLELVMPDEVASARLSRRARMESRSDDNPDTVAARLVTSTRCSSAPSARSARCPRAPAPSSPPPRPTVERAASRDAGRSGAVARG